MAPDHDTTIDDLTERVEFLERRDRRQVRTIAGLIACVAVLALTVGWLARSLDARNDSVRALTVLVESQTRSDEAAACRSEYVADLDEAQRLADIAEDELADAESRRDDLVFLGLVATATNNDAALQTLVTNATEVIMNIATERRERDDAEDHEEQVAERRAAATSLSRSDPAAFVDRCRLDFG